MFFKLRCFKGGVASQPVAAERATTRLTAPHTARWTHELSLSPSASLSRSLSASTPAYATPACHATPSLLACHTTPSLLACAMRCDSATPRLLQRRAVGGPHANLSANAFWQLPSIAMGALSFLLPLALVCGLRSQVSPPRIPSYLARPSRLQAAPHQQWFGTAPWCSTDESDCTSRGMKFVKYDERGDGDKCWSGNKVLCELDPVCGLRSQAPSRIPSYLARPSRSQAGPQQQWFGTAPACSTDESDCTSRGMKFVKYHKSGDGKLCWSGRKVLCELPTQGYKWIGTAPNCMGVISDCAANNMAFVLKHNAGDGTNCLTGTKACRAALEPAFPSAKANESMVEHGRVVPESMSPSPPTYLRSRRCCASPFHPSSPRVPTTRRRSSMWSCGTSSPGRSSQATTDSTSARCPPPRPPLPPRTPCLAAQ